MNNHFCVTGGTAYTDIDTLACALAFAELRQCVAVLPGAFNATIPESIRRWDLNFVTAFDEACDQVVVVDVSNPRYLPSSVAKDRVIKVFDHHTGFEDYWGAKGQIERVGACATLIFELFESHPMSSVSANLLSTAIVANTLNFNASITTTRDRQAFDRLRPWTNLPNHWIEQYYAEVAKDIFKDFESALQNDLKILNCGWAVAQLELYDATSVLNNPRFWPALERSLDSAQCDAKRPAPWLLTIPSIREGRNYFVTNSPNIKKTLAEKINAEWSGLQAKTNKLYLRKEILKLLGLT